MTSINGCGSEVTTCDKPKGVNNEYSCKMSCIAAGFDGRALIISQFPP